MKDRPMMIHYQNQIFSPSRQTLVITIILCDIFMAPKAHKAALAELSFSDFTVRLSETEDEFRTPTYIEWVRAYVGGKLKRVNGPLWWNNTRAPVVHLKWVSSC